MATSKLQEYTAQLLEQYFLEYKIRENYRWDKWTRIEMQNPNHK